MAIVSRGGRVIDPGAGQRQSQQQALSGATQAVGQLGQLREQEQQRQLAAINEQASGLLQAYGKRAFDLQPELMAQWAQLTGQDPNALYSQSVTTGDQEMRYQRDMQGRMAMLNQAPEKKPQSNRSTPAMEMPQEKRNQGMPQQVNYTPETDSSPVRTGNLPGLLDTEREPEAASVVKAGENVRSVERFVNDLDNAIPGLTGMSREEIFNDPAFQRANEASQGRMRSVVEGAQTNDDGSLVDGALNDLYQAKPTQQEFDLYRQQQAALARAQGQNQQGQQAPPTSFIDTLEERIPEGASEENAPRIANEIVTELYPEARQALEETGGGKAFRDRYWDEDFGGVTGGQLDWARQAIIYDIQGNDPREMVDPETGELKLFGIQQDEGRSNEGMSNEGTGQATSQTVSTGTPESTQTPPPLGGRAPDGTTSAVRVGDPQGLMDSVTLTREGDPPQKQRAEMERVSQRAERRNERRFNRMQRAGTLPEKARNREYREIGAKALQEDAAETRSALGRSPYSGPRSVDIPVERARRLVEENPDLFPGVTAEDQQRELNDAQIRSQQITNEVNSALLEEDGTLNEEMRQAIRDEILWGNRKTAADIEFIGSQIAVNEANRAAALADGPPQLSPEDQRRYFQTLDDLQGQAMNAYENLEDEERLEILTGIASEMNYVYNQLGIPQEAIVHPGENRLIQNFFGHDRGLREQSRLRFQPAGGTGEQTELDPGDNLYESTIGGQ